MESEVIKEWEEALNMESYSKLGKLNFQNGVGTGKGLIDIIDGSGILWRTFTVKISIPKDYPISPPVIFETKGEIRNEPDWHVNWDGSCCVGPNTKVFRKLGNNLTIKRWLDIVVMPYFFDQVHKLEKGFYKGMEHAHGVEGLINDYKEWWGITETKEIIDKLNLIVGKKRHPKNKLCFCGIKKKYKKCHLNAKYFDNIPLEVYRTDLKIINMK